jgi:transcription initiation factor IIE alpha subunit
MENTIHLPRSTARVARAICSGGHIKDSDIQETLGLHRNTVGAAYRALAELNALSYTSSRNGPKPGLRLVTIHEDSWVWMALNIETAEVAR